MSIVDKIKIFMSGNTGIIINGKCHYKYKQSSIFKWINGLLALVAGSFLSFVLLFWIYTPFFVFTVIWFFINLAFIFFGTIQQLEQSN